MMSILVRKATVALLALLALLLARDASAVDRSKFRTCALTGFCKRQRDGLLPATAQDAARYSVTPGTVLAGGAGEVTALVSLPGHDALSLSLRAYEAGVLRVRLTEQVHADLPPRYEAPDVTLGAEALAAQQAALSLSLASAAAGSFEVQSADGVVKARIQMSPFLVEVLGPASGQPIVTLNGEGLLHFEQRKHKPDAAAVAARELGKETGDKGDADAGADADADADGREVLDWGEDGKPIYADGSAHDAEAAETVETAETAESGSAAASAADAPESFGGHTDGKPHGATGVGLDVRFPGAQHVYGLPEHAAAFDLKTTRGDSGKSGKGESAFSEPYRNYNLDVFEYELDEPMALYGHIPLVMAVAPSQTASVFWHNPSETFVDVTDVTDVTGATEQEGRPGKQVRFMSESGVAEVFVSVGPSPAAAFRQYASVTGTTPVPPMFALGYHQCRWNYRDANDVREVNAGFERHDLPYDVLWLDIEHTDGKRYFTWDGNKFADPRAMQDAIKSFGRKMVTIVDPHMKRDDGYYIHKEAAAKGLYVKDKGGAADFKGWCWPGDSSYLDFTSAEVRAWWAEQFLLGKYEGSTDALFTWNDMNEPSVFNGPEVSMPKDALSLAGVEHREWHNLYGFYNHMATAGGQVRRSEELRRQGAAAHSPHAHRPFVLSRSFFAGSQRHGAIWTGDNKADWAHLAIASEMLLSLAVAGLPFAGADVGGFFGNPSPELTVRWYQAGALQPFFRGHAHIDTKRREPWLLGADALAHVRRSLNLRYSLLPLWYALFREHETSGAPVMRPLWFLAPHDENTYAVGDAWLLGDALLVKPVVTQGATQTPVYLPAGSDWFQFESPHARHVGGGDPFAEDAPLGKVPVFQRAGSVVPRKMRVRRSSHAMRTDPYTLVVALDAGGAASGSVYVDDETTVAYRDAAHYCDVALAFADGALVADKACASEDFSPAVDVERVVVLGLEKAPEDGAVTLTLPGGEPEPLQFKFDQDTKVLTVRKPVRSFMTAPFTLRVR